VSPKRPPDSVACLANAPMCSDTGTYQPTKGESSRDSCKPCPLGTFQNQTDRQENEDQGGCNMQMARVANFASFKLNHVGMHNNCRSLCPCFGVQAPHRSPTATTAQWATITLSSAWASASPVRSGRMDMPSVHRQV